MESPLTSSEIPCTRIWCLRASSQNTSSGGACSRASRLSAPSEPACTSEMVGPSDADGDVVVWRGAGEHRASSNSSSRGIEASDSRLFDPYNLVNMTLYCSRLFDSLSTSLLCNQYRPPLHLGQSLENTYFLLGTTLCAGFEYPHAFSNRQLKQIQQSEDATNLGMLIPLTLTTRLCAIAPNLSPSAFHACITRGYSSRARRSRGLPCALRLCAWCSRSCCRLKSMKHVEYPFLTQLVCSEKFQVPRSTRAGVVMRVAGDASTLAANRDARASTALEING